MKRWLRLICIIFSLQASFTLKAQHISSEIISSPGSTVVNNNGKIFIFPTLIKHEQITLPPVNEEEKKRILRETLVPLLEKQRKYIRDELSKISSDYSLEVREKYLRLERADLELKHQIAEFSGNLQTTLDDLLLRVKISNEDILTILRQIFLMVSKLYDQATEKEKKKAIRDTLNQQRLLKYKTGQQIILFGAELGLVMPFIHLQKNNWSHTLKSNGGIQLGCTVAPIFRNKAILNPQFGLAVSKFQASRQNEAVTLSAIQFKAVNDFHLYSFEDIEGFGRLSFPVGFTFFIPTTYKYENSIIGLPHYSLDKNGENREIKRLNQVQAGVTVSLKYIKSWSVHRNLGFNIQYSKYLTNMYRKEFGDQMSNYPYVNLKSKSTHVTLSVVYYLL